MKLWLVLSRFEIGGLERVQANLAPALASAGLDVSIVTGKFAPNTKHMLPPNICTMEIAAQGKHRFIPGLLAQLYRYKPNIVISTSNDVACLLLMIRALFFPRMKVICTQHLSLTAPWKEARGLQRLKHRTLIGMMRHLWPQADAIISVSSPLDEEVRSVLRLYNPTYTIYNPVVLPGFDSQRQQPIRWPWPDQSVPTVIFVGRLVKVKRLDLLLKAFHLLVQKTPARLLIVGDGLERVSVLEFISTHHLTSICHLAGHQDNPLPWIQTADLLVLPSDYEGFGNVLVEAMACGTQVISTDCPHGPAEILEHGLYGQLVAPGNAHALSHAMQRALSNEFHVSAQSLAQRAQQFSLDTAARQYLDVIMNAASRA